MPVKAAIHRAAKRARVHRPDPGGEPRTITVDELGRFLLLLRRAQGQVIKAAPRELTKFADGGAIAALRAHDDIDLVVADIKTLMVGAS
jgi:hypothetical protein